VKVYEAIANAFVKEGTSTIFGLLGDGNMLWAAAMSKYPGIKNVDARDEGAALTMAEGWARATGKIGICSVTHGPGITRMMTSLVSVTRCSIPVVICTSATELNNDGINQFIDQKPLVTSSGAGFSSPGRSRVDGTFAVLSHSAVVADRVTRCEVGGRSISNGRTNIPRQLRCSAVRLH
jgi:hypothetical protein